MQIPILNGITADALRPDFRSAYPLNLMPVPKSQGISEGYLRPAEGIVTLNDASPGPDRGGIVWNGFAYRIMGTKLCRVDLAGIITVLGDVGGSGYVNMDYSFTALGFASNGALWYSTGGAPFPVTDVDAGNVLDAIFIAGYWMFTDGTFIAVTDLNDPLSVNPLRYGSSEVDPDPVVALKRIRDEAYAVNRFTIEGFRNVGGVGFPWQVIQGSQIMRGAVGRTAVCVFESALAFVGGGRDEGVSVYLGENGDSLAIASREIEQILEEYTTDELAQIVLEPRVMRGHKLLYLHLPDKTLLYDATASVAVEEPAWCVLQSGLTPGRYRMWGFCLYANKWIAGDPEASRYGLLSQEVMTHWAELLQWEFGVPALYNDGNPAIIHEMELVALPGRVALGDDPVIWTSSSKDGVTWTAERSIKAGKIGDRTKRLVWLGQGMVDNWRVQRFRGTSDAPLSFARLEARVEPLNRKRGNGA
jgi:hypothetical protein